MLQVQIIFRIFLLVFCLTTFLWVKYGTQFLELLPLKSKERYSSIGISVEDLNSSVLSLNEFSDFSVDSSIEDEFTILLFTFKYKRISMLNHILSHLSGLASLSQVLIIWSNPDWTMGENLKLSDVNYSLRVYHSPVDSLNIRFFPLRTITTNAVFILDDDIVLSHKALLLAFNKWRENPDSIVGFKPRGVEWSHQMQKWKYVRHPLRQSDVSIVLPGAAFLHRRYLWLYTYQMPDGVHKWIDDHLNCEDIAMNFLVSNYTKKPPIPVLEESVISSPWLNHTGISRDPSHKQERDECINYFSKIYGENPLIYKSKKGSTQR